MRFTGTAGGTIHTTLPPRELFDNTVSQEHTLRVVLRRRPAPTADAAYQLTVHADNCRRPLLDCTVGADAVPDRGELFLLRSSGVRVISAQSWPVQMQA